MREYKVPSNDDNVETITCILKYYNNNESSIAYGYSKDIYKTSEIHERWHRYPKEFYIQQANNNLNEYTNETNEAKLLREMSRLLLLFYRWLCGTER